MRCLAVFLCVCIAFCLLPCGVIGEGADGGGVCTVTLGGGEEKEGVFEVSVGVSADGGLCGVLCAVRYDPERLILMSAGAECGGATFSFVDIGGEVRFLIDGAENFGGATVSLFFAAAEGACGKSEVEIIFAEAYCFADEEIEELEVEISGGVVRIGENKAVGGEDADMPALVSWEIGESNGREYLSVSGRVGSGFFAAGVELFVVRGDGSGEKMFVVGVLSLSGGGEFDLALPLGKGERCAIVITPVAFDRDGCVRGGKTVIVS